jgi:energy-coupling factor transporter ATP-binding protein EcfA2
MSISPTNDPKDILATWIALEVLSPQTFRKAEDLAGTSGSIVRFNKSTLPWLGDGEQSRPNYRLYYQVVLATIDFGKAISALLDVYADKKIERPPTKGEAIMASVLIDRTGCLIDGSAIGLSSFAWGLPKALKGELKSLAQWTTAEDTLIQSLDGILRRTDEHGEKIPLDISILNYAALYIKDELKIPLALVTGNSFAIRTYQYYKNPESPESLLLNSFFIGDLITARDLFKDGKATSNLQYYLAEKKPKNRKDLLNSQSALEQILAPELIPAARWPGPGRHPLVVLQQSAVNAVFKELKTNGMLAVNGPPGTGKTTLLRDIVAQVVTQRAEAMAEFGDPADAFTKSREKVSAGPAFWTLFELDESLKGFELLIASSNNKAVENVSAELPGITAIADDADDLRYFTCTSDALLEKESWGLIAAVLGNAINRAKFRENFWWNKDTGFATYLAEASGSPQLIDVIDPVTGKVTSQRQPKIVIEEDAPDPMAAKARWKTVRKQFQEVLQKSKSQLIKLEKIRKIVISLNDLFLQEKTAKITLKKVLSEEKSAFSDVNASDIMYNNFKRDIEALEERMTAHLKMRPGFFVRLFGSPIAKIWKQEQKNLKEQYTAAQIELAEHKQLLDDSLNIFEIKKKASGTCQVSLQKITDSITSSKQKIEIERTQTGSHLIDDLFFALPHTERQVISPWCNAATQKLRDDVFVAAVKLHKAFVDSSKTDPSQYRCFNDSVWRPTLNR